MRDDLRRVALFTSGIAEITRNRAERFVRDWVRSGDLRRDQAQGLVKELVDWSMHNRKELTGFIRSEIEAQLSSLGVASRRDVERLERRMARLEETLRSRAAASAEPARSQRKTTRAKTSAKRTTAKKTARGSSARSSQRKRS